VLTLDDCYDLTKALLFLFTGDMRYHNFLEDTPQYPHPPASACAQNLPHMSTITITLHSYTTTPIILHHGNPLGPNNNIQHLKKDTIITCFGIHSDTNDSHRNAIQPARYPPGTAMTLLSTGIRRWEKARGIHIRPTLVFVPRVGEPQPLEPSTP
jgi:hypothetical protein